MNRTDCTDCGGVLERGFIPDRGDHDAFTLPYWVQGEPEEQRFLGMSAGLRVKGRPSFHVVSYRCRSCGLLKLYAPKDRAR